MGANNLLSEALFSVLKSIPDNSRLVIGYSGGVDSHVLLKAVADLHYSFTKLELVAMHINHGLSQHAKRWEAHCQQVCDVFGITLYIKRVKLNVKKGESLEAVARDSRYNEFAKFIKPNDYLLVAHHIDDQAETCLLQFLRGSGPKGLASMAARMNFADGFLLRPLLNVNRRQILAFAKEEGLKWIEDESNRQERFTRNFLRNTVMPLLQKKWPNVAKTIMRVSLHSAEADQLLQECAANDLKRVTAQKNNKLLDIEKLKNLSLMRQKNILRYWIQEQGFLLPSTTKLHQVFNEVIDAAEDASPCVHWGNVEIRRYQNKLYALHSAEKFNMHIEIPWDLKSDLKLPVGILCAKKSVGNGLLNSKFSSSAVVRFRVGGEVCRLPKRKCTHKLKKLFQQWNIPPWERERIPLVFVDGKLAVIVGYSVSDEFATDANEPGIAIEFL